MSNSNEPQNALPLHDNENGWVFSSVPERETEDKKFWYCYIDTLGRHMPTVPLKQNPDGTINIPIPKSRIKSGNVVYGGNPDLVTVTEWKP